VVNVKASEFLDIVRRSGLVEREQLQRATVEFKTEAAGQPSDDAQTVAEGLVKAGLITRWHVEKLLEGRHRGFFLGKYKLLGHLGSGGMSQVYLAEHTLMQRRVAIKVLPKNRVDDSSYLQRFQLEAQAAAALDHRNIVRAYDLDKDEPTQTHYIVMEFIDGRDLQAMVKTEGPLEYARAAEYIRQAAEGLSHAHQAGLIHRDIKPANLLVDKHNVVKVLDLGLARFTGDEQASLTVAYDENVLGTADYLAPEQARDSHGADARADIYSLGCTLYYLLTGTPPFPDGSLPERLMAHQKVPPPSILAKRPDAPQDLIAICLKMMAKKPAARYQSAQEVADALATWLTAHDHRVDPGGSGSSIRPATPKRETLPARESETQQIRRIEKSPGIRRTSGSNSDILPARGVPTARPIVEPAVRPATEGDTLANSDPASVTGSGSHTYRLSPTASDPEFKAVRLPVARPLDEGEQKKHEPEAKKESDVRKREAATRTKPAQDAAANFADYLMTAPVQTTARLGAATPVTPEDLEAYKNRAKGPPKWLWYVLLGGFGLAVLLLILVLIFH
jgi:serine/threonine-protein kinase